MWTDTQLFVTPNPKEGCMEVARDFVFYRLDGRPIWIPRGYLFDGASIPWLARPLIGGKYDPEFLTGACIHDWCHVTRCVGFKEANTLFKKQLEKDILDAPGRKGMSRATQQARISTMYGAVSTGGYLAWRGVDKVDLEYIYSIISPRYDRVKFETNIRADYYWEYRNKTHERLREALGTAVE